MKKEKPKRKAISKDVRIALIQLNNLFPWLQKAVSIENRRRRYGRLLSNHCKNPEKKIM